jgi:integrase
MAETPGAPVDINLTSTGGRFQRSPADGGGPPRRRRRRRGNAEGTVFQRKDGRWVAAVSGVDGRGRVYRYGKTRAEAAAKLTKALKAVQDGLPIPGERQTVGQYLQTWLEESAKPAIRPATYASYACLVRMHLVPELGHVPLAKLTPQQLQSLLNRKLASGLAPRRVAMIRGVLRTALNQALRWGLVARNVAALVSPPRVAHFEVKPLNPQQARAFLQAVRGDRLEALYTVALAVGLRQGETLGLRWGDVDLEAGVLHVRHALQRVDGKLQLVEPKSARSRRTIVLPDVVSESLRAHRARQTGQRLLAGAEWADGDFVFTTALGRPLNDSNVTHTFQRHVAKAGLPRQRFHDLRHACASLLLAQGVNPRTVMDVLGHSQISLTLNTYSHVFPGLQEQAAAQMNVLLTQR